MTSYHPTRAILCALALTLTAIASAQAPDKPPACPNTPPTPPALLDPKIPTDCTHIYPRTAKVDCTLVHMQTKTIYLNNVAAQNDANEILVAVRNVFDPSDKIYLLGSRNAIVIASYPEEIARMEAFIHELDTPRKSYRITFTLKDSDNSKPQRFTLEASDGQRVTLKQGSKIPVLTGSFGPAADPKVELTGVQTQYTYLDVGMNFDVTLTSTATGAILKSKIEQSALASEKSPLLPGEPIINQSVLDGTTSLTLNKPSTIGDIDIPGTTRHMDIEVTLEQLH
jgi:type II secretory pathway component GspD/PulD (secretin)